MYSVCRQYLNPINDLNAPALHLDHLPVEEKDIVVYPTNYSSQQKFIFCFGGEYSWPWAGESYL